MIAEIEHPNVPDLKIPNSPLKLSESPSSVRRPPPLLGQHNEEVLGDELGISEEELARLAAQGIIGKRLPTSK